MDNHFKYTASFTELCAASCGRNSNEWKLKKNKSINKLCNTLPDKDICGFLIA